LYSQNITTRSVAQISRFERWKDPEGVSEAFRIASNKVKATLVLLGNVATDDPEGREILAQSSGFPPRQKLSFPFVKSGLIRH
jgi:hypothetical protein